MKSASTHPRRQSMLPLKCALAVALLIYGTMCLAFWYVAAASTWTGLRIVWAIWGTLALMAPSIELAWLLLWFAFRCQPHRQDEFVPLKLDSENTRLLADRAPRVDIIIPANNEASHPDDAKALEDGLYSVACNVAATSICETRIRVLCDTRPSDNTDQQEYEQQFALIQDSERAVIRAVNERIGQRFGGSSPPVVELREYREKPADRRTKQGSIELYLQTETPCDFILVLDADSSFEEPDPNKPDTVNVLDRLVAPMLREQRLSMIQCAIHVTGSSSVLGWLQRINAKLAVNYHGPLNGNLLAPQQPSYGHNVIFRHRDLVMCYETGIPQAYLSHDYIEAALLAIAGKWCVHTQVVASQERAEESADGYVVRDHRWQKGNAQWMRFILGTPRLPVGVLFFLSMGIINYFLPLAATCFLMASSALLLVEGSVIEDSTTPVGIALVGSVVIALIGPKVAAGVGPHSQHRLKLRELLGALGLNLLVAPPLSVYAGIGFLCGPLFGTRWRIRASRQTDFNFQKAAYVLQMFVPSGVLGAWLTMMIWPSMSLDIGSSVVLMSTVALVISPLTMLFVSCPLIGFQDTAK